VMQKLFADRARPCVRRKGADTHNLDANTSRTRITDTCLFGFEQGWRYSFEKSETEPGAVS
jgi:hypothetical protein